MIPKKVLHTINSDDCIITISMVTPNDGLTAGRRGRVLAARDNTCLAYSNMKKVGKKPNVPLGTPVAIVATRPDKNKYGMGYQMYGTLVDIEQSGALFDYQAGKVGKDNLGALGIVYIYRILDYTSKDRSQHGTEIYNMY